MTKRFPAGTPSFAIAWIVLTLLCVGCLGRSPEVRRFTLGSQARSDPGERAPHLAVLIGPIRVPEYLERNQIARRAGGGAIEFDEFDRWLGGFEANLTTAIADDVRRQLGSVRVVAYPSQAPFPTDYAVRIHVDEWIVDASNTLRVSLRWAISATQQGNAPQLSAYEDEVDVRDRSAEALVEAHDRALAEFARLLADRLVEFAENR